MDEKFTKRFESSGDQNCIQSSKNIICQNISRCPAQEKVTYTFSWHLTRDSYFTLFHILSGVFPDTRYLLLSVLNHCIFYLLTDTRSVDWYFVSLHHALLFLMSSHAIFYYMLSKSFPTPPLDVFSKNPSTHPAWYRHHMIWFSTFALFQIILVSLGRSN